MSLLVRSASVNARDMQVADYLQSNIRFWPGRQPSEDEIGARYRDLASRVAGGALSSRPSGSVDGIAVSFGAAGTDEQKMQDFPSVGSERYLPT